MPNHQGMEDQGMGTTFATAAAKRYRECSVMLHFQGKSGRKRVHIVRNYGGRNILRI